VLCDFDCFHACAETHCSVGLGNTTNHASANATDEVRCAEGFGVVFCFGSDEEKNGSFGGGFDPGPRNQSLVDCSEYLSAWAL